MMSSPRTSLDFEAVFGASPNPYMVLDRELRFVAANHAYQRVTATCLADLIGRHILDVFPHDPGDPANVNALLLRESFERVLASRTQDVLALLAYRVPRGPDATVLEERFWSATHIPILDEAGEVAFILQHTVDVTELNDGNQGSGQGMAADALAPATGVLQRARLLQETNRFLDEERKHLRSLFEQSPGFVCVMRGPTHLIELANRSFYQLIGDRDLIGKTVREVIPELAEQGYLELLDAVFASGDPFTGRAMPLGLNRTSGQPLETAFVDFVLQPIVDSRGVISGIFVQGHDVSEQRRLQSELDLLLQRETSARADADAARVDAEHANRLKDEFLATLSHELRTPLNVILGRTQMLARAMAGQDPLRPSVLQIARNGTALAHLVEDLLDVSRITLGQFRLSTQLVDVLAVLDAAMHATHWAAESKGIEVAIAAPPQVPPVSGDPTRLQQVFWNLFANAVKFTAAGGRVDASVTVTSDEVVVSIVDSGIGIAPELLPHVFQPFWQVSSAVNRTLGGLGLGLAIVRRIVELHGGVVSARSDGEGRGSTFEVRLPYMVIPM